MTARKNVIASFILAALALAPAARATIFAAPPAGSASPPPATARAAASAAFSNSSKSHPGAQTEAPPPATSGPAPAGIADYSYIEVRYTDMGSSDYFGDSAKGPGAKFSFQFGRHAYVFGSYDRLDFDRRSGNLERTGVGIGYQQTRGRISAYVQIAYFREAITGANGYYFQPAYGMRAAFGRHFYLEGELYSDFHPDFGSRPLGLKFGVAGVFGPVSVHLVADHNRDVNSLVGVVRFSF